jgi:hypothetical protein
MLNVVLKAAIPLSTRSGHWPPLPPLLNERLFTADGHPKADWQLSTSFFLSARRRNTAAVAISIMT